MVSGPYQIQRINKDRLMTKIGKIHVALKEIEALKTQIADLSSRLQQAEEKFASDCEMLFTKVSAMRERAVKAEKERDEAREDVAEHKEALLITTQSHIKELKKVKELRGLVEEMERKNIKLLNLLFSISSKLKVSVDRYENKSKAEIVDQLREIEKEYSEELTKYNNLKQQSTGLQDHSHYNLSQMQGINDGECDIGKQLEKERNDPGEKTIYDQDHSLADNPAAEEVVKGMEKCIECNGLGGRYVYSDYSEYWTICNGCNGIGETK